MLNMLLNTLCLQEIAVEKYPGIDHGTLSKFFQRETKDYLFSEKTLKVTGKNAEP